MSKQTMFLALIVGAIVGGYFLWKKQESGGM